MIAALAFAALGMQPALAARVADFEARVVGCGIAADRLTARYEPELQDTVLFIGGSGVPSVETLTCVAQAALEAGRIARFTDPAADLPFGDAWAGVLQRRGGEMARERLREHGRLEPPPLFDRQRQTLAEFAVELERFCGVEAGTVLRAEDGMLAFVFRDATQLPGGEQVECVANAAAASDAVDAFGFFGNP